LPKICFNIILPFMFLSAKLLLNMHIKIV